ncbi:class D beta-lactamase [Niveibacterium sp. 24ML]|uniref:class D beta-lactamase n=1 Tax=Niveibacterium sp. 24ML TaxID=2985512 RepID=UPI00227066E3|nr:class D beta-lactamase [Niveibacterium sp. 24ML]MCX9155675.1 class D beta-lactamase [Niveibacterium sp. 24ML]
MTFLNARIALLALLWLLVSPVSATETWQAHTALNRHFKQAGLVGTIVVFDDASGAWAASDSARAYARYLPASTFKIPNTLIALESGVVADEQAVFKWDGKRRFLDAWNQDQTLQSAFQVSAVWTYQEIARKVGAPAMQQYLWAFRYGNARPTPKLDSFWLDGDLRISAVEQIEFLRRFNEGALPLSPRTTAIARRIMLREEADGLRLFYKTGWADDAKPPIGWFVGWLERPAGKVYFALNMDMPKGMEQAPLREKIARAVLNELGYLPARSN